MRAFKFPLTIEGEALIETSESNPDLESGLADRIKMLLLTGKNSRPFSGDYGLGIEQVFTMIGGDTTAFKQDIVDSINRFIPEVNLNITDVEILASDAGTMAIEITYPERDLNLYVDFQIF